MGACHDDVVIWTLYTTKCLAGSVAINVGGHKERNETQRHKKYRKMFYTWILSSTSPWHSHTSCQLSYTVAHKLIVSYYAVRRSGYLKIHWREFFASVSLWHSDRRKGRRTKNVEVPKIFINVNFYVCFWQYQYLEKFYTT